VKNEQNRSGLTIALDSLTDEAPQEFSAEIAERRRLVVVNGEIVRTRTQLIGRYQTFTATTATRRRASTSTRWHVAFAAMLS